MTSKIDTLINCLFCTPKLKTSNVNMEHIACQKCYFYLVLKEIGGERGIFKNTSNSFVNQISLTSQAAYLNCGMKVQFLLHKISFFCCVIYCIKLSVEVLVDNCPIKNQCNLGAKMLMYNNFALALRVCSIVLVNV